MYTLDKISKNNILGDVSRMNTNTKLFIYDILDLIDSGIAITCKEVEKLISKGKIVNFVLERSKNKYLNKGNLQEVVNLIAINNGVFSNEIFKNENGLLYLIQILLDC